MIRLGDKKKYIDLTGLESEGEVVYVDDFNYVTKHELLTFFIESQEVNRIFGRNKVNESFTEDTFMVHNKPLNEIPVQYQTEIKNIRGSIKSTRITENTPLLLVFKLDDKPMCVNVVELKKLYKSTKITGKYL